MKHAIAMVLVCLLVSGSAYGIGGHSVWPHNAHPYWEGQTPYQRDIYIYWTEDPMVPPGSGIPGTVYDGVDDDVLKVSDFVTYSDNVFVDTEYYRIGVDNLQGSAELNENITIHIDNWDDQNLRKNVFVDLLYGVSGAAELNWSLSSQPGFNVVDWAVNPPEYRYDNQGMSWYLLTAWWTIEPNPEWEELRVDFTLPPGSKAMLNHWNIATQCVPEPATLGLLALGGLAMIRRRRFARQGRI